MTVQLLYFNKTILPLTFGAVPKCPLLCPNLKYIWTNCNVLQWQLLNNVNAVRKTNIVDVNEKFGNTARCCL